MDFSRLDPKKKNSPQALQPAGCPVDWLGLTEVVTLRGPPLTPVPADMRREDQPILTDCCERMFLLCLTKAPQKLLLEQPL